MYLSFMCISRSYIVNYKSKYELEGFAMILKLGKYYEKTSSKKDSKTEIKDHVKHLVDRLNE